MLINILKDPVFNQDNIRQFTDIFLLNVMTNSEAYLFQQYLNISINYFDDYTKKIHFEFIDFVNKSFDFDSNNYNQNQLYLLNDILNKSKQINDFYYYNQYIVYDQNYSDLSKLKTDRIKDKRKTKELFFALKALQFLSINRIFSCKEHFKEKYGSNQNTDYPISVILKKNTNFFKNTIYVNKNTTEQYKKTKKEISKLFVNKIFYGYQPLTDNINLSQIFNYISYVDSCLIRHTFNTPYNNIFRTNYNNLFIEKKFYDYIFKYIKLKNFDKNIYSETKINKIYDFYETFGHVYGNYNSIKQINKDDYINLINSIDVDISNKILDANTILSFKESLVESFNLKLEKTNRHNDSIIFNKKVIPYMETYYE